MKRYVGDNLVVTLPYDYASQSNWQFDYLFKNHIGSIDVITDETGFIKETLSFNSWGQRQNNLDLSPLALTSVLTDLQAVIEITDRGYTGHEQLDGLGLIHMNGRIYDPYIGQFTQADPHIQDPLNTQSLNRYTYVLNNPLTLTDPTGYFNFRRFWNKTGRTVAAIVVTIYTGGAAAAATSATQATAWVFAGGFVAGGISSGNIKGAIKGAVFAIVANGLGGLSDVKRISGHLALSGVDSVLSGDKFGHGVASAGIGMIGGYATSGLGDDWGSLFAGTLVNAMVSGTASEIAGGKFATGALSGALRYAFNDNQHSGESLEQKQDGLRNKYLDFIENNPNSPVQVSKSDFENIVLALEINKTNDLELSDHILSSIKYELDNADGFFFEEEFRSHKFVVEGYRNNNGKGYNGSTINYYVVGMRFASLNSSLLGRGALVTAVIEHNRKDLERGGNQSYMLHNRKQALDTGQYWSGIGFNSFRDQTQ